MNHNDPLRWLLAASIAGAVVTNAAKAQPACDDLQKLLASDAAEGDWFGRSVSISGDVAIVGAPWDDDNGSFSGSAYVYRSDGVSWTQEQKLLASDGAQGDWFGWYVSISGDVAIVGAPYPDDNGSESGSAYVYRSDGVLWTQEQKLLASDGAGGDSFGVYVSISGDVAIVGARLDDDNGSATGSAYVYRSDGVSWIEEQKLLASDGAEGDWFGWSVSISGDVAIVGAIDDDDNGPNSGSAYVYRSDGVSWMQEQKLLASDGATVQPPSPLSVDVVTLEIEGYFPCCCGMQLVGVPEVMVTGNDISIDLGYELVGSCMLTVLVPFHADAVLGQLSAGIYNYIVTLSSANGGTVSTLTGSFSVTCPDSNSDDAVDVDDLINVILDWGTDGSTYGGDVNSSGVVDADDLVAVILAWGACV